MPKITYDLTSSSNWNNLSGGEHTLQVVAKATGYLDSAKSTSVSFTKEVVTTKETWLLYENAPILGATYLEEEISFESNSTNYTNFWLDGIDLNYDTTKVYDGNNEQWLDQAYRTITFETAPTGELLTWLQANAVKQSEG